MTDEDRLFSLRIFKRLDIDICLLLKFLALDGHFFQNGLEGCHSIHDHATLLTLIFLSQFDVGAKLCKTHVTLCLYCVEP